MLRLCLGSMTVWLLVGLLPWKKPPPIAQVLYMLTLYAIVGWGVVTLWVS